MNVYTVRDSKVEAYMQPFFAPNHGVAIRLLENTVKQGESLLATNTEDFSLFFIGTFNEQNGVLEEKIHQNMGKLVDIIPKEEK